MIYHYRGEEDTLSNPSFSDEERKKRVSSELKKQITSVNLSFLVGSGCSVGAIELMKKIFEGVKEGIKEIAEKGIIAEEGAKLYKKIIGKYSDLDDIEGYLNWINKAKSVYQSDDLDKLEIAEKKVKEELIKAININYEEDKSKETLSVYKKFYEKVFKNRLKNIEPIDIFTTNYDLFNEIALEEIGVLYTNGFKGSVNREFDINSYCYRIVDEENKYKEKWSPIRKYARLYKLHGSIDWQFKDNNKIHQKGIGENPEVNAVVIYPTLDKHYQTQQSPYSELFREFSIKLQKPNTTLIVIGYGFPDQHINNMISQSLNQENFNLIIFSNKEEEKVKKFYIQNKNKKNLHLIGGDLDNKNYLHYFENIISLLDE
ncbi:MAG: SIR2 family protein [Fusobacteriaceae bacterium]